MLSKKETNEILNDLYLFYRVFITSNFNDDLEAEHIDLLSQQLTRLHLGDVERLCVAMPPSALQIKYGYFSFSFMVNISKPRC